MLCLVDSMVTVVVLCPRDDVAAIGNSHRGLASLRRAGEGPEEPDDALYSRAVRRDERNVDPLKKRGPVCLHRLPLEPGKGMVSVNGVAS